MSDEPEPNIWRRCLMCRHCRASHWESYDGLMTGCAYEIKKTRARCPCRGFGIIWHKPVATPPEREEG